MHMTKKQQEALWLSIEHWLKNWEKPESARIFTSDCECCNKFKELNECWECPIKQYTGYDMCFDTPYSATLHTRNVWIIKPSKENFEKMRASFEREYAFLVQLALG